MAVNYARFGSGTLTLGATPLDVSCQVVGALVGSTVETGDAITTLCGDQITSGLTTSSTLSGTMILDPIAGGVGEFTWTNHGTEQPFEFTPNDEAGVSVSGTVLVTRLDIGGEEYGAVMQPEFEWAIVGEPIVTWGTAPPP